jgi:Cu2+-containing amine oxidase
MPSIMVEEFVIAEELVRKDPLAGGDAQARHHRLRPVHDRPVAHAERRAGRRPDDGRFVTPLTWLRTGPEDHGYGRPVEGVVTRVDLDTLTQERNLTDTDMVVWFTFGTNHVVRPEDWPVTRAPHRLQADARGLLRRQPGAGHPGARRRSLSPSLN